MQEDLYDVCLEEIGTNVIIITRLAAAMSLTDATIFMRTYMTEYYNDHDFSLLLCHSSQGGIFDGTISAQEAT